MPIRDHGDVRVIEGVLAENALTKLRDADTDPEGFRGRLRELGRLCGYEIAPEVLETQETIVETPVSEARARRADGSGVVVVNVLRAATPFVEGIVEVLPGVRQGFVSASREESGQEEDGFPVTVEYVNLPEITSGDTVIIADPMLATGSTMLSVAREIESLGQGDFDIVSLSVVSSQEGIDRVRQDRPEMQNVTVSIDDRLNEDGYILPGLGDAGDRAFGTGGSSGGT
jgi:uracil phosphoribosyltransferase